MVSMFIDSAVLVPTKFSITLRRTKCVLDGLDALLGDVPDHYLHAAWQCAPVNKFWQAVCKDLSALLGRVIPASPSLCALGDLISISV